MKSPELCGRAFALAGIEPRGRYHTHVRSEMFANFKLSRYDNYQIFPFADLERMTSWAGGGSVQFPGQNLSRIRIPDKLTLAGFEPGYLVVVAKSQ